MLHFMCLHRPDALASVQEHSEYALTFDQSERSQHFVSIKLQEWRCWQQVSLFVLKLPNPLLTCFWLFVHVWCWNDWTIRLKPTIPFCLRKAVQFNSMTMSFSLSSHFNCSFCFDAFVNVLCLCQKMPHGMVVVLSLVCFPAQMLAGWQVDQQSWLSGRVRIILSHNA